MPRKFRDLAEPEILALAISLEEEDGRIYGDFADGLRATYPATAKMFEEMQAEEAGHGDSLIETYHQRFGEHIPLVRRQQLHPSPVHGHPLSVRGLPSRRRGGCWSF